MDTADERARQAAVSVVTGTAHADDLWHVQTYLGRHRLRVTGDDDTDAAAVLINDQVTCAGCARAAR